ncbi:MAG: 3'-5' exonuclease [Clostridia bacterium]|nr:3'-5' exonuclease [Clostridia bacterium]
MKLVFFDIECASVHKTYSKICAFGYVVCDENFNILVKEDILINPRGRFELTDRKGEKGITLPYEYSEFKKHPSFPSVYKKIKSLLEDKDACVLGHAVLNDVKYLNLETKRYKLPSLHFKFSDSQLIYMTFVNDFSRQFGLESIAENLGVEFTPHRAADDAYATMRIVEAMCKAKNCGYFELIKLLSITDGEIENYNITRPQSQAFKKYNAEKRKAKEARSKARVKFNNHFLKKRFKKDGKLGGATFTFSRIIEDDLSLSMPLVDKIYENGGKYSQQLEFCKYYVEAENDGSARTVMARNTQGIIIIGLDGLGELLND